MRGSIRQFVPLVAVAIALLGSARPVLGQSFDLRHVDALRQRRQFAEAEQYCQQALQRTAATDASRATIVAELIRTKSQAAIDAPPEGRERLWAQARQTAAEFLRQTPPPLRARVVQFQDALTQLAQGEVAREEHELRALPTDRLEQARQRLRAAAGALEGLYKDLEREIPQRRRTPPRAGELSADELASLTDNVGLQLARAQKNRALLFEGGSADRVALLISAAESLERTLPQLPDQQPLKPLVQLELAEIKRLLGQLAEGATLAQALDQPGQLPQVRSRAAAELLRIAVGQRDTNVLQRLLSNGASVASPTGPEYDLARLDALLFLARSVSGEPVTRQVQAIYQEQAAAAARQLEATHGAYWGRRASQLIASALPRGGAANADLLSRAADSLYLRNEFDLAIAAYEEAAVQAGAKGEHAAAFELYYKAALVEQKRGRHLAAAQRLQSLATRQPAHPQAPAAHLLAAWNSAQEARTNTAAATAYGELLAEHIALFASAETADQARLWLGKLHESQGQWSQGTAVYGNVARGSPHYPAAIEGLARCWQAELTTLAAAGRPTADAAREAIQIFRTAIAGPDNRWPERWTPADRAAALAAAELIVAHEPGSASDAEELLRRALAAATDAPPAWHTAAQAQLVVAVSAQGGRHQDALAELMKIGANSPEQVLNVLEGLSRVTATAAQRARPTIAPLQLAAANMLADPTARLSADQQQSVARIRADALAALGRRDEALAAYEKLSRDEPDNGLVQEGYARLLLASPEAAHWKLALDRWRLIAFRSQPHSARWQEAKYSVALAQFKLGDRANAATLLRMILETAPGMVGTEWEQPYRELLRQCTDAK